MARMKGLHITIDTYHEFMCEAFSALRSGLSLLKEAEDREEDDTHLNYPL